MPKETKITGKIKQKFNKAEISLWFFPERYKIKLKINPKIEEKKVAIIAWKKVKNIAFEKFKILKIKLSGFVMKKKIPVKKIKQRIVK